MTLSNLSGIVALLALVAFGVVLTNTAISQNVATWVAWGVLNSMMLWGSMKAESKSAWKLSLGCTVGVWFVALMVLKGGSWHVGIVEIMCLIGTVVSVVVWKTAGPKAAIVALVVAMDIAGVPAVIDALHAPDPRSWWLWAGFTTACALSFLSQKSWTIEDRLYPGVQFLFNLLMLILVIR